jgi:hypothetical protein
MSQRLSPEQKELCRRIDEVLFYLWDPIGVAGAPEARDEYEGYVPHVFSLLMTEAGSALIAEFLVKTETEDMGLTKSDGAQERARKIADLLQKYHDVIVRRPPLNEAVD